MEFFELCGNSFQSALQMIRAKPVCSADNERQWKPGKIQTYQNITLLPTPKLIAANECTNDTNWQPANTQKRTSLCVINQKLPESFARYRWALG